MARWVAFFIDREEVITRLIRERHAQEHFDYLAEHQDEILIGGGLRPDENSWYSGGMWVLEVASKERAIALCEADPYLKLGLRKSYELHIWGKAPCYDKVIL